MLPPSPMSPLGMGTKIDAKFEAIEDTSTSWGDSDSGSNGSDRWGSGNYNAPKHQDNFLKNLILSNTCYSMLHFHWF